MATIFGVREGVEGPELRRNALFGRVCLVPHPPKLPMNHEVNEIQLSYEGSVEIMKPGLRTRINDIAV